ncbi:uL30 family ribosomal protein [Nanoarchaeota archaeon]
MEEIAPEQKKQETAAPKSGNMLAAVVIRSALHAAGTVKDTLFMLGLRKKNACVIVENNPSNRGMLDKVKDYATYGEISSEILSELKKKDDKAKVFHLHPPRGGFERKGIKKPFYLKGALGYRGDKIGDLLKKML